MYANLNVFMRIFSFLSFFFISSVLFSQIETNGELEPTEIKEIKEKKTSTHSGVELFITYHGLQSNRTLEENKAPWGDPLGSKENEVGEWVNSFSAGVRTELGANIYLDMGVGYFTNQQSVLFESVDSTFSSLETFRHIGVPLKIAYISPGEIAFYAGVGVMPKAFLGQAVSEEISTSAFGKQNNDFIVRNGFERVLLDLTATLGVRAELSEKYGAMLAIEGRRQLTNNYDDQGPYIRKSYHVGFSFGLQFYL